MIRARLLTSATSALLRYLQTTLSTQRGDTDWWKQYVVANLSVAQAAQVKARNFTQLSHLDLAALLRVFQRNISELTYWTQLPPDAMTLSHIVVGMRNSQAHSASGGDESEPEDAWREADAALRFLRAIQANDAEIATAHDARESAIRRMFEARRLSPPEVATSTPIAVTQATPEAPTVPRDEPASNWPKACTVGPFTIFGPGPLSSGEIQTFEKKSAPATTIPWLAQGLGAELTVHISLLDDPEPDQESGVVMCVSRNSSPQKWDEIVKRLRIGIRCMPTGELQMDLRTAFAMDGNRPTRSVVPLLQLSRAIGVDVASTLKSVGANAVGTRESTTGDISRNRGWPCVLFPRDNLLPAISGWVLATAMAFDRPSSSFA